MLSFNLILIALPVAQALIQELRGPDDHDHSHDSVLTSQFWHHTNNHPAHALFKRAPNSGAPKNIFYAPVGSSAWSRNFPPAAVIPDPKILPAAWVNAFNSAVAAGKIPNIPVSNQTAPNTNPIYPDGLDPNSPGVCSATYQCRIPGDIWDSPDGVFASAFDDGPTPSTTELVQFLQSKNRTTTHFMIGSNIIGNPNQFKLAFESNHDIAVHTWTHPYMTTLNNLQVVGELGWTMQLIANSTGGRLPKFWRPPYGDSDVRVTAIAREVFGLQTVIWNQDTSDWQQTSTAPIQNSLHQFLTGPKSPGLIVLEHELRNVTVEGFTSSYDMIKSNGWNFQSLAQVMGNGRSYMNAQSSLSNDVVQKFIISSSSSSRISTNKNVSAGPVVAITHSSTTTLPSVVSSSTTILLSSSATISSSSSATDSLSSSSTTTLTSTVTTSISTPATTVAGANQTAAAVNSWTSYPSTVTLLFAFSVVILCS